MTIFHWVIGTVTALMALGALGSFLLFVLADVPVWLVRARRFRHWTWMLALFWFNLEVWGRVVLIIVRWH